MSGSAASDEAQKDSTHNEHSNASGADEQVNLGKRSLTEFKLHAELVGETGKADEVEGISAVSRCRLLSPVVTRPPFAGGSVIVRRQAAAPGLCSLPSCFFTRPDPPVLEFNCVENLELGEEPSFESIAASKSTASASR